MLRKIKSLAFLATVLVVPVASAAVVYDNGGPVYSPFKATVIDNNTTSADDFVVGGRGAILTGATIYTSEQLTGSSATSSPWNGSITYSIFSDNGSGVPVAPILYNQTVSGAAVTHTSLGYTPGSSNTFGNFRYAIGLSALNLAAGHYWLAISAGSVNSNFIEWNTTTSNPYSTPATGPTSSDLTVPSNWSSNTSLGAGLAFSLSGTVLPAPSTVLLMAIGITGLGFAARRKQGGRRAS